MSSSPKFNFQQNVAPVQDIKTDTSGGDGGESHSLAYGYNTSEANGGVAVGGEGGDGNGFGGRGGDSDSEGHGGHGFFPWGGGDADSEGGNGGDGVGIAGRGGDAEANGGHATTYGYTNSSSSADGGHGGPANVYASQNTPVNNDFKFDHSFNENSDNTYVTDSYNRDNHGVDNQGGHIDHSVVAGHDIKDAYNTDDHSRIDHSFNTDNSYHNVDNSDDHSLHNVGNSDDHSLHNVGNDDHSLHNVGNDDHSYHSNIDDSFNHPDNDVLDLDVKADHLIQGIDVL